MLNVILIANQLKDISSTGVVILFFVTLYSEQQLELILNTDTVLHLDATGSIFKSIQGLRKRMLLYSLILPNKVQNEPPIAIAEMVANMHNTEIISHFLLCLRMDCNRLSKKPITRPFTSSLVVTDFSWVLIHSVLHELNDALDINAYLTKTYASLVEGHNWSKCTGVFLCVNHVVHIVAKKCRKYTSVDAELRETFMQSFVLLQYSRNFQHAMQVVRNIFTVFGVKNSSSNVKRAKRHLIRDLNMWHGDKQIDFDSQYKFDYKKEKEETEMRKGAGIRSSSPWLTYFRAVHEGVSGNDMENENDSATCNRFF
jgi:hypothetical protein